MTSGAHVAAFPSAGGITRSGDRADSAVERPLVGLATFAALGFYGVIRWGTLLSPAPTGRLLGLLALAVLFAGAGGAQAQRSRAVTALAAVAATLAAFPLAGVPLAWVWHARIGLTADGIGQGLSALPRMLVPYTGINQWVRMVIVLGAAVLLLDAAFVLAFTPRALGDLRRAGAAVPLVALAVVPSTLVRPGLPYVQGLLLFVLLAAFIWGERLRPPQVGPACLICCLAAVGALVASPGLDAHKPWLNYQALTSSLLPTHAEAFDWNQTFGPLRWPQSGRELLDVQAQQPEYWKAEDLDVFDGYGWRQAQGQAGAAPVESGLDPAQLKQAAGWSQTIKVTIGALKTTNLIAAGEANNPQHLAGPAIQGASLGTYRTAGYLGPGDSYTVTVYNPDPTTTELEHADTAYAGLESELTVQLPGPPGLHGGASSRSTITFPPFHSDEMIDSASSNPGATTLLQASPYARAYTLARTRARQARTPYDFITSVMRYLSVSNGFSYNQNAPISAYPLETFLFGDKLGYCQQFSGAMALLLRMGGIPARVAAGFTTGSYDSATHQYAVTDTDAHDWVEAFFPPYGWVRFDPTPASDPALGGHSGSSPLSGDVATGKAAPSPHRESGTPGATPNSTIHRLGGSSDPILILLPLAIVAAMALLAAVALFTRRGGEPGPEQLLDELERALRRCGRPIGDGVTLAALEQRFRASPDAAAYIRSIRLARYAGRAEPPTAQQRQALRAQLSAGLGVTAMLRALWALPPQWKLHWWRSRRHQGP
jgi:Transglutaminase-like superfamily